jgi:hypothetical protein
MMYILCLLDLQLSKSAHKVHIRVWIKTVLSSALFFNQSCSSTANLKGITEGLFKFLVGWLLHVDVNVHTIHLLTLIRLNYLFSPKV